MMPASRVWAWDPDSGTLSPRRGSLGAGLLVEVADHLRAVVLRNHVLNTLGQMVRARQLCAVCHMLHDGASAGFRIERVMDIDAVDLILDEHVRASTLPISW